MKRTTTFKSFILIFLILLSGAFQSAYSAVESKSSSEKLSPKKTSAKTSSVAKPKGGHVWEYKRKHGNMYKLEDEVKIGEMVQKRQISAFKAEGMRVDPESQKALKARIENIVRRIAQVSDIPSFPYEVHIYDDPKTANAFCMPGGKIGVYTGLFDSKKGLVQLGSDNEIAAVMAHEIAHATMRHVTRQMTTSNGLGILGAIVSIGAGVAGGGGLQNTVGQLFNTGMGMFMPSYSRKHEAEADRVGFYYMTKAGFDPQASIQIWERAATRLAKEGKSSKTSFLGSHPGSADRAAKLKAFLPDVALIRAGYDKK